MPVFVRAASAPKRLDAGIRARDPALEAFAGGGQDSRAAAAAGVILGETNTSSITQSPPPFPSSVEEEIP